MIYRAWNVWSNLIYAAAGISALIDDGFSPFVLACIALCLGSGAYHLWLGDRKREYWSHHADELGMYMVFSSLVLIALGWHSWFVAVPIWILLHFVALRFSAYQTLAVIASILVGVMLANGLYIETATALLAFGSAYVVKIKDHDQGKVFGLGHAAWHLFSGCMIGYLYGVF